MVYLIGNSVLNIFKMRSLGSRLAIVKIHIENAEMSSKLNCIYIVLNIICILLYGLIEFHIAGFLFGGA
jgi:hypothetical protein